MRTYDDKPKTEEFRLLETLKQRENDIQNKKAEICSLREKVEDLMEVLDFMVRGVNKLEVPR